MVHKHSISINALFMDHIIDWQKQKGFIEKNRIGCNCTESSLIITPCSSERSGVFSFTSHGQYTAFQ